MYPIPMEQAVAQPVSSAAGVSPAAPPDQLLAKRRLAMALMPQAGSYAGLGTAVGAGLAGLGSMANGGTFSLGAQDALKGLYGK